MKSQHSNNAPRLLKLPRSLAHTHSGLALVFVLIMMTIVFSVVAVTARISTQSERAMRNDRDRQIAFHAAEAAIDDALFDITSSAGRKAIFTKLTSPDAGKCLNESDATNHRGICGIDAASILLYADSTQINWDASETSTDRKYVTYGDYSNNENTFGIAAGGMSVKAPRYIVQKMDIRFPNVTKFAQSSNSTNHVRTFLVTAVGYGASVDTKVFLQATIFLP